MRQSFFATSCMAASICSDGIQPQHTTASARETGRKDKNATAKRLRFNIMHTFCSPSSISAAVTVRGGMNLMAARDDAGGWAATALSRDAHLIVSLPHVSSMRSCFRAAFCSSLLKYTPAAAA
jgi:hypothetical protein